jgi:hypothetical protein
MRRFAVIALLTASLLGLQAATAEAQPAGYVRAYVEHPGFKGETWITPENARLMAAAGYTVRLLDPACPGGDCPLRPRRPL